MSAYNRKDHLYKQAKTEGLASRAAYKIVELNNRFKLARKGGTVLDLGSWPGGWLQQLATMVGPDGVVVGIDLQKITEPLVEPARFIQGDAAEDAVLLQALNIAGGRFDLITSDMSPKLSGIREVDQAATVHCAQLALDAASQALRKGGNIVIKLFKGSGSERFVKSVNPVFNKVTRAELRSTRKTSNEFYLVGEGFDGTVVRFSDA